MSPWRPAAVLVASALAIAACQDLQLVHVGGTGGTTSSASSAAASTGTGGAATTSSSASSASSSSTGSTCYAGSTAAPGGGVLFGDTTAEERSDGHYAGLADISSFVAVGDGVVQHLSAYYDSGTAAQLLLGLYDDNLGEPNHLLAQGSASNPAEGTWVTVAVPAIKVTKGTTYWIALLSPLTPALPPGQGAFVFRYAGGPMENICGDTKHSEESLSALPDPWKTSADFPTTLCSFYASQ